MDTQDQIRGGNACIFLILKFLNLIYAFTAIGLIVLGIWLWIQFKAFDIMELFFICLGILEFILVLVAWTARKSVGKLKCYRFFIGILFLCQLTITILGFSIKQSVIDSIIQKTGSQDRIDELQKYYEIVIYYVLGSLVIMAFMMALTHCYISSLKNRNLAYDYKVLDEEGRKITINEKNRRDADKVSAKYDVKREEMMNKYDTFKEYKKNNP